MLNYGKDEIGMQSVKLSTSDKQTLKTAYMHLYDALVLQYQSKNMSYGKSWDQALNDIKKILAKYKDNDTKVAMDYLMEIHSEHKNTTNISPDKREHAKNIDSKSAIMGVKTALDEFEKTIIQITHPNILVILPRSNLVTPHTKNFYDWAANLPEEQIDALEKKPEEFARQYKKFILSRGIKKR